MYNSELKRIADAFTVPVNDAFHGWIITLNGRIWKTWDGKIFHESREKAVRRFYNEMRWRVRRELRNSFGRSNDSINNTSLWFQFKKINNFEVKEI